MAKPALLLYCQHSLGMGHLVRSLSLVRALTRSFEVVLLNGGRMPHDQPLPRGAHLVQLPPIGMDGDARLSSLDERYTLEAAQARRRELLLEAQAQWRPQVVVIELFPFGRKKFAGEILALIEAARRGPAPALVVCSLRDILVASRPDQQAFDDRVADLANRHFDAVLVHADPSLARLEDSFRPRQPLRIPVHYSGFVSMPRQREAAVVRERRVVVSAGGGIVGEPLFRAACSAHRSLWPRLALPMTIVAGPFLPEPQWRSLEALAAGTPGLELRRSVPDLGGLMQRVTASVSQCGYNTAMDIVSSGVSALVVPFTTGAEDEQCNRARRLQALGAVRMLEPGNLDAAALAAEIEKLLVFRPSATGLDLGGAQQTGRLLVRWLQDGGARIAAPLQESMQ